jgi:regulatory protein
VSEAKSINEINTDLFLPEEVDRYSNPVEARKKAMDYLARREYGRMELVKKLLKFGFEPDVAASAVDQLRDDGLQDDRRFAESFLQSRISQGKGPVRTRLDLGERGLEDALIEDVLDESAENWVELAIEVRRKKFGAAKPRDFKEKARQMRFLQYRGFEPGHIQRALAVHGDD